MVHTISCQRVNEEGGNTPNTIGAKAGNWVTSGKPPAGSSTREHTKRSFVMGHSESKGQTKIPQNNEVTKKE